jgi:hypothetical protein
MRSSLGCGSLGMTTHQRISMDPLSDAKIIDSWHTNATPWTAAVR